MFVYAKFPFKTAIFVTAGKTIAQLTVHRLFSNTINQAIDNVIGRLSLMLNFKIDMHDWLTSKKSPLLSSSCVALEIPEGQDDAAQDKGLEW